MPCSVWLFYYRASQGKFPLPSLSGPASSTRDLHLLLLKGMLQGCKGVMRHTVPCDTDTPDDN